MFLYWMKRTYLRLRTRIRVRFSSSIERSIYIFNLAIMRLDFDSNESIMTFFTGFHDAGMSNDEMSKYFLTKPMQNGLGEDVAQYVTIGRWGGSSNIKFNIFERVMTATELKTKRNAIIPAVLLSFLIESHHSLREKDLMRETLQALSKFSAENVFDLLKRGCDIDTINKYGEQDIDIEMIYSMLNNQLT